MNRKFSKSPLEKEKNLPLMDVSSKVGNCFSSIKKDTDTFTPDKRPNSHLEGSLLSPDEIPPTPPLPKRPRLERKASDEQSATKLKPKALIPPTETNIPAIMPVSAPKSKDKTDFYKLGRHKVIDCVKMIDGRDRELQLVVEPQDENITVKRTCRLRDFWFDTAVEVGDIVHIQSDWYENYEDENGPPSEVSIIDSRSGLIVVRPDLLVSGTSVVSSLFCKRKAVLSERFRGTEPTNLAMLNGTIVHRLLQKVLMEKTYDRSDIDAMVDSFLTDPDVLHDLYGGSIGSGELKEDIFKYVPMIQYFVEKYIQGKKVSPPLAEQQTGGGRRKPAPTPSWDGRIESVCDIEENMWSPWLGVKGKVDFTVKVKEKNGKLIKMPLELKTGRSSFSSEHKGQVTLYTMMMNRTVKREPGSPDPAGLLLYLKDASMQSISAGIGEKQGLVQLRNEMVRHLTAPTTKSPSGQVVESTLPPRIDRIQACGSCPLQIECTLYQTAEVPEEAIESLPAIATVAHLSPSHRRYFSEWSLMLRLEWMETQIRSRGGTVSDIWCVDPLTRQARGTCLSFLQVATSGPSQRQSELSQYSIKLVSLDGKPFPSHITFQTGDNVVLSTDTEVAVANGFLIGIDSSSVTLATDRNVNNWERSFKVLHLDKLDYQGGQSLLYSNLSRLMADTVQAARLRQLIVDKTPPTFDKGFPRTTVERLSPILSKLNKLQQKAVLNALLCRDYCLIRGLPGTGKSSLIVALIRLTVLLGQSVLLSSYTHSAVDNVLLKLTELPEEERIRFVRIGREHRTHPSILPYSSEILSRNCRTVQDLEDLYSAPVIAATCLSVGHPALYRRRFDLCIIDEAAQALQLAVIGPLTCAKRFVLVGDPEQLPPVVQSRDAKLMGMDESLFVRLSGVASGVSVVSLHDQYRMCAPITALANALTYKGDLKCGNKQVEEAVLSLPELEAVKANSSEWLFRVIQPGLIHSLIFLDTSLLSKELRCHTGINERKSSPPVNRLEADLAIRICRAFKEAGLPLDRVGLIAPYQSQVQHLKQLVERLQGLDDLEINTVDQYQGRDKEAVLYSCTKSTEEDEEDGATNQTILHDLRRLTVAVTRAKRKLIIVGDGRHLQSYPPFARLLSSLEEHQRYRLCSGADGFDSSTDFL